MLLLKKYISAEGKPETQGRPTCLIMNQGVDVIIIRNIYPKIVQISQK
jgi:hypothetical protein